MVLGTDTYYIRYITLRPPTRSSDVLSCWTLDVVNRQEEQRYDTTSEYIKIPLFSRFCVCSKNDACIQGSMPKTHLLYSIRDCK